MSMPSGNISSAAIGFIVIFLICFLSYELNIINPRYLSRTFSENIKKLTWLQHSKFKALNNYVDVFD